MQVTVDSARRHLSKLIAAAVAGEGIITTRGSTPVAKLVPVVRSTLQQPDLETRRNAMPDFLAPLDKDELALWEGDR